MKPESNAPADGQTGGAMSDDTFGPLEDAVAAARRTIAELRAERAVLRSEVRDLRERIELMQVGQPGIDPARQERLEILERERESIRQRLTVLLDTLERFASSDLVAQGETAE